MLVFSKFSISMGNACNIHRLYYQIHVLIMQGLQKLIIEREGHMRIKTRCQTYYCCTYNHFHIPLQTKDKGICKGKVIPGAGETHPSNTTKKMALDLQFSSWKNLFPR